MSELKDADCFKEHIDACKEKGLVGTAEVIEMLLDTNDRLNESFKQLNRPNQWVSVESDIKPKMYQQVIIYTTDEDFCPTQRLAHWNGEKEGFLVGGGYRDRQATHWQPLPQPPEGE